MTPRTAVVTVTRGRDEHLARQRRGLTGCPPGQHVVVGMGEEPRIGDGPPATVVRVPVGEGGLPLAEARNAGAAAAIDGGAELLVFLDVDCIPEPVLLDRYAAASARVDGPALLCGPVHYLPPPPPGGYPDTGLARLAGPHPARPAPPDGELWPETRWELFWSLSFAVTVPTWRTLGGFCTGYAGYGGEDTDLAQVAASHGAGLYWVGGAVAHHQHHPPSVADPARLGEIVRNANLFHRRWGWWPMGGWLDELAAQDKVAFDRGRATLEVRT
ncbi:MAG: galactosyltransferase-related protein [Pseudonocardia sediminis]